MNVTNARIDVKNAIKINVFSVRKGMDSITRNNAKNVKIINVYNVHEIEVFVKDAKKHLALISKQELVEVVLKRIVIALTMCHIVTVV